MFIILQGEYEFLFMSRHFMVHFAKKRTEAETTPLFIQHAYELTSAC